jgi:hypothetical protein
MSWVVCVTYSASRESDMFTSKSSASLPVLLAYPTGAMTKLARSSLPPRHPAADAYSGSPYPRSSIRKLDTSGPAGSSTGPAISCGIRSLSSSEPRKESKDKTCSFQSSGNNPAAIVAPLCQGAVSHSTGRLGLECQLPTHHCAFLDTDIPAF